MPALNEKPDSPLVVVVECFFAFLGAVIVVGLIAGFLINAVLRDVPVSLIAALVVASAAGIVAASIRPVRKRIAGTFLFASPW